MVEPYIDETDYWCSMPVRVSHAPTAGVVIELGPYTPIDPRDIARLRAAIRSWAIANNGPGVRRVK